MSEKGGMARQRSLGSWDIWQHYERPSGDRIKLQLLRKKDSGRRYKGKVWRGELIKICAYEEGMDRK